MRRWLSDLLRWLLLGLAVVAVAVRRRTAAPLASAAVVMVLAVLDAAFAVALAYLSYGAGRSRDEPRSAMGVLAGGLVGAAVLYGVVARDGYAWLVATVVVLLAGALLWAFGRLVSDRQELAMAGWRRASDLEREQQVVAVQARLLERSRIARDLHDSLGHELSLIALRAGALELAPALAPEGLRAARALREDVAVAVERLRAAVEMLREEPAAMAPVHEPVPDLVERARASGLDVDLRMRGRPVALEPAADLALHRVVQEALTNAVKHAPGARVTVVLEHSRERVDVRVSNPLTPRPGDDPVGRGLLGLRERLRLVGGALHAQRRDGCYVVEASVPVRPPAREGGQAASGLPAGGTGTSQAHAAARRRVRSGLLLAVGTLCAAVVVATAFWVAKTHDATLDRPTYDRIAVGDTREELADLLPEREATRGWSGALPAAAAASLQCSFYTDGNYPGAFASYRLCFSDGVLVSKDDVRS